MRHIIVLLFLSVIGLVVGAASALWMSGLIGSKNGASLKDVNVENWVSDWSIGSAAADGYTRARVARFGLLGLAKSEAVYFMRAVDDDGSPLLGSCTYEIKGGTQEALWWSITLYDEHSRLPMNNDGALSIDATQVNSAKAWSAIISSTRPDVGNWISNRAAQTFDLTLRLYQPSEDIIETPEKTLNTPSVRKISCGAAS